MGQPNAGFQEIEHTADWELEVWAPDLTGLLEQAALGMYALSGTRLSSEPRVERHIVIEAADAETLLVSFLSELLYISEQEGLAFDEMDLDLEGYWMEAYLKVAPLASIDKEIKAVTYHNLAVQTGERGLKVSIVFDV